MYVTKTIEETELIYSLLRERFPDHQIAIEFNDNTKEYKMNVTNELYVHDPEVPVTVAITTVYGDTDSIFLSFKYNRENYELNRKDTFKLAMECGDQITNNFNRQPICLEFEKIYQPFVLLTKKRYIGKKFEDYKNPMKLKELTTSGIAITRRDYCIFVKNCYREIIDCIMEQTSSVADSSDAVNIYRSYIERIKNYDVPIEQLTISSTLAKHYTCSTCKEKCEWKTLKCKNSKCSFDNVTERLPECKLCQRKFDCLHTFQLGPVNLAVMMLKRNKEISVNDRIQYIFVEKENVSSSGSKAELTEEPDYPGIKFNRACYTEQLAKPILAFLKIVLKKESLEDLLDFTNKKLLEFGGKTLANSVLSI